MGVGKADVEKKSFIWHTTTVMRWPKLRARLTSIRKEFDSLQTKSVSRNQSIQIDKFSEAEEVLKRQLEEEIIELDTKTRKECTKVKEDLALFRKIQTENLEFEISQLPEPRDVQQEGYRIEKG